MRDVIWILIIGVCRILLFDLNALLLFWFCIYIFFIAELFTKLQRSGNKGTYKKFWKFLPTHDTLAKIIIYDHIICVTIKSFNQSCDRRILVASLMMAVSQKVLCLTCEIYRIYMSSKQIVYFIKLSSKQITATLPLSNEFLHIQHI